MAPVLILQTGDKQMISVRKPIFQCISRGVVRDFNGNKIRLFQVGNVKLVVTTSIANEGQSFSVRSDQRLAILGGVSGQLPGESPLDGYRPEVVVPRKIQCLTPRRKGRCFGKLDRRGEGAREGKAKSDRD